MPLPPLVAFLLAIGIAYLVLAFLLSLVQTRRFYFVRHGETLLNAEHIRQGEDGALSKNGAEQAEKVGLYLSQFHISRIISSTYPRAKETAEIIHEHIKVPIVYSPLLVERKNPSEIIGRHTKDPEVIRIIDQMDLAYHTDDYRFSDEETFVSLKKRARKCLTILSGQGTNGTIIVTHHVFLKMLIAYMLYREELHAADFIKLSFFNFSDNAGITVCDFHPLQIFSPTRGWEVLEYNTVPQ